MKEYIIKDYGKKYDDSFRLSILLHYISLLAMVVCLISTVYSVYCNYSISFLINYMCFCINSHNLVIVTGFPYEYDVEWFVLIKLTYVVVSESYSGRNISFRP